MVRAIIDGAKAFGTARPRAVVVASRNMVLFARWCCAEGSESAGVEEALARLEAKATHAPHQHADLLLARCDTYASTERPGEECDTK